MRVEIDDVPNGILNAAEMVGTDLIILGPHRSRLRDVFIGTTVERVVRVSRFPLLVAVQSPSAPHRRTLLALDFDEASKSAARAALAMGIFERSDVTVMHAFDAPAEGMLRRSMDQTGAIEDYVAGERERSVEKLRDLVQSLGLPPSDHVSPPSWHPAGALEAAAMRCPSDRAWNQPRRVRADDEHCVRRRGYDGMSR